MPGDSERAPYVAIVLYETSSDAADYEPLYREDIVVVYAESAAAARERAMARARAEEGGYANAAGEVITWRLKHLVDVTRALDDDLGRDTDLYARHFRDYDAYRAFEPLL
ncbi:DUF4288 domain-containing protein [Nocardia uniformis]|uniref:DUF4288 domain-containing protein n=1 Tax=Nocardia uniformis TaxID=53432 RepID=A0A849CH47_9NOCA|nr:DUF4288 domain-containing protein [Nocardia uniformis]NNH72901.1 DUF4288 domain-containing protein [Nocardia uniformis]